MDDLKHILESLLFISEDPLTPDRVKRALPTVTTAQIREAADELAAEYEARTGGFYLTEVAGGYQLRTRPEYAQYIKRLIQPKAARLSRAALETLAIVAYKQPIIRADIERIRGVDCGGILRALLEKRLIRILGRKEIPGRPLIYATTKLFLEVFGLKGLKDLPTPKEIEALGDGNADQQPPNSEDQKHPESAQEAEQPQDPDTENQPQAQAGDSDPPPAPTTDQVAPQPEPTDSPAPPEPEQTRPEDPTKKS